jgi:hypothetical protein
MPATQLAPTQQPMVQVVLLQMQAPFTQRWPDEQALPLPQAQTPWTQESARFGSQLVQAPPPVPQAKAEGCVQMLPAQHPEVQVSAQPEQTPFRQESPWPQVVQAVPPQPQAAGRLPGWQASFWQQPPAQPMALQTQAPLTQARPGPQGEPLPQWQLPPVQLLAVIGLQVVQAAPALPQVASEAVLQVSPRQQPLGQVSALQTHIPLTQAWPDTQAGPLPQVHAPSVQASERVVSQAVQALPVMPQAVMIGVVQTFPLQQPFGQEVESQRHWPPAQNCPLPHSGPVPHMQIPAVQLSALVMSQVLQVAPALPQ